MFTTPIKTPTASRIANDDTCEMTPGSENTAVILGKRGNRNDECSREREFGSTQKRQKIALDAVAEILVDYKSEMEICVQHLEDSNISLLDQCVELKESQNLLVCERDKLMQDHSKLI
jgi:hypothetical protein